VAKRKPKKIWGAEGWGVSHEKKRKGGIKRGGDQIKAGL